MELLGYVASAIIGVSLGLIGGGGSILTVPVLVYLMGVEPVVATAYSLFIVGSTALVGAVPKWRNGVVNVKTAIIFGIPSIAAVYATRAWLVPLIPQEVFTVGGFVVTKSILLMLLFAVLMVAASISMIHSKNGETDEPDSTNGLHFNYPLILLEGVVVGMLTGLVGAGGGFLIIPALVLLAKLPMKEAVGTSLLIIGMKSLLGFTGDLGHYSMDWMLLLTVTGLAIAGIFVGNAMSKRVSAKKLKIGFGWFVLMMGIYIIVKEIFIP
ncbi:MAG: sulfite exporter TauE/SafE family protein [Saprospiraceae bacterium]|nr:sulfite exporter TauE/SafE family protein [Saprospiraceae bacterium]